MARVYDFSLESGSYNLNNLNENQWDLAVYDIQPYLDMTLNQNATLTVPTFIEGKSSGATGFIRYPVEVGQQQLFIIYKEIFILENELS